MKIAGEPELRARLDPGGELFCVEFHGDNEEDVAGSACYRVSCGLREVGMVVVSRRTSERGQGTLHIDEVSVEESCDARKLRDGIALSILALSSAENRVLLSDPYGLSFEETAMWYWFRALGVATIEESFTQRPELLHGQPVFDGSAMAPPIG